jgi:hypothetical protein
MVLALEEVLHKLPEGKVLVLPEPARDEAQAHRVERDRGIRTDLRKFSIRLVA